MSNCSVDDCPRPVHAKGICFKHYMRVRRRGDPKISLIDRDHAATCSVDGCDRPYGAKGLCNMHWQRRRSVGHPGTAAPIHRRYGPDEQCGVQGCDRRPTANGLCEMHYDRVRDHGFAGAPNPKKGPAGSGHVRYDGYTEVRAEGHPLARKGRVLLHRLRLYDMIGEGIHTCHWCGTPVVWTFGVPEGALVVDHLDGDRGNNDASNLVPSCHRCNSVRRAVPA